MQQWICGWRYRQRRRDVSIKAVGLGRFLGSKPTTEPPGCTAQRIRPCRRQHDDNEAMKERTRCLLELCRTLCSCKSTDAPKPRAAGTEGGGALQGRLRQLYGNAAARLRQHAAKLGRPLGYEAHQHLHGTCHLEPEPNQRSSNGKQRAQVKAGTILRHRARYGWHKGGTECVCSSRAGKLECAIAWFHLESRCAFTSCRQPAA